MKNRSVVEIMVLTFTFVVGFVIVGLGVLVLFVEARNPEADTDRIVTTLMSLSSAILGALLGLIAGKASGKDENLHEREDGTQDDL